MKNLLVFASGDKEGGGSGFVKLVEAMRSGVLQANIVGVVSNHAEGGVCKKAETLGIPFLHFPKPWTAERYQRFVFLTGAHFIALSGWLKRVVGFSSTNTINIHPGPLPLTKGLWGHHVHEAVIAAFRRGEIKHTEVCMHFVTENYDEGPIFFRCQIEIADFDTAEELAARVNRIEHRFQSVFTNKVVNGEIFWDGKNPKSLFGAEEKHWIPVGI